MIFRRIFIFGNLIRKRCDFHRFIFIRFFQTFTIDLNRGTVFHINRQIHVFSGKFIQCRSRNLFRIIQTDIHVDLFIINVLLFTFVNLIQKFIPAVFIFNDSFDFDGSIGFICIIFYRCRNDGWNQRIFRLFHCNIRRCDCIFIHFDIGRSYLIFLSIRSICEHIIRQFRKIFLNIGKQMVTIRLTTWIFDGR